MPVSRSDRIFLSLSLIALACTGCAGNAQPGPANSEPRTLSTEKQIQYPQPDVVLTYKSTPTRELRLHIFNPSSHSANNSKPAILFFHGGGWKSGSPEQFFDQSAYLASLGMVAISAEYRLEKVDKVDPRQAVMDASSAMRYVRANAKQLGVDTNRIAAGGGSAGGHLAASLATIPGYNDPKDDLRVSKKPDALVLFNPVLDNGPGGYGYERVEQYWTEFSPIHNIADPHPPAIFILGTADHLIPVSTGERYCKLLRGNGSLCELHLFPEAAHGFFLRRKSEPNYLATRKAMTDFLVTIGYLSP